MSKDMVKQVRITVDGDIEFFDAELVNSFSELMNIIFSGSSEFRCEKLDVIAKELDADGAFIVSQRNEGQANMMINALYAMNADIGADIESGKLTSGTFPYIYGDVDIIVFKDGNLVPAGKVVNILIPYIAVYKFIRAIEEVLE